MIRDLSETLQTILTQPGLPSPLAEARIMFDRPTDQFNPSQTAIDLFLFDIQENKELRSNEPAIARSNGLATIRQPPLRVACSYLVTAWPVGGAELALQEQRLLSQVLQVLSRYPTIPEQFLQGSLRQQLLEGRQREDEPPPLPAIVSTADGLKGTAEFWTALNSPLRASLMVTVTLSMEVSAPETAPLTITRELRFGGESWFQIGGQVIDGSDRGISRATVVILERNLTATTDAEGYYKLGPVPPDIYTLQVQRSGAAARDFPITVPAIAGGNYNVRLTT
jgi:Pvc16 N-terminal domain/Carboxypeptidase regulatory-like domain